MLDSGFMSPLHLRSSDRNVQGGGCAVATREKIACSCLRMRIIAYIMYYSYCNCLLHTKPSLHCCNLIPARFAGLMSSFEVIFVGAKVIINIGEYCKTTLKLSIDISEAS